MGGTPLSGLRRFPLSTRFAGEGDDTLGAGRPFLGVSEWGRASFMSSAMKN